MPWLAQSIAPEDTRGEGGGDRFMPFSLRMHVTMQHNDSPSSDDWFSKYTKNAPGMHRSGTACCAKDAVVFTTERDGQLGEVASYLRSCV